MTTIKTLTVMVGTALVLASCGQTLKPGQTAALASTPLGTQAVAGCGTTNLALNKASLSSSNETNSNLSGQAFDGSATTRWSSAFNDPQWIYVNLGSVQALCGVSLQWEGAYAKAFQIQVSNDAQTWTPVYSTTTGTGGNQDLSFPATSAQYVRMYGTQRGTAYGYSLYEFSVYGPGSTAPTGPVCFYADANYQGASFCASADSSWIGTDWNDRVSSVKVQSGYQVQLFNDINYGGTSKTLTADAASLPDFNDLTSSFKVGKTVVTLPTSDTPDFGPNVKIYEASTPASTIQADVDSAFNAWKLNSGAQFGSQRYTFLFKPGSYGRVWANVGFYTTLAGLGKNPDDVTISGAINVDSGWNLGDETNATQNFWRSAENLSVVPEGGTDRWAVSQAAPMRRVHIKGALTLAPSNQGNPTGYASGGYLADVRVDGAVSSGSQQQWYTRDSTLGSWNGGVWNMVFSGVSGAPAQTFPNPPSTTLATTPVSREKPYLYFDGAKYQVFVPSLRSNSAGVTWPNTAGTSIPLSQFYVARPSDSAATLNQALSQGLNLFFTPGVYHLSQTLSVTRANTVIFGLGFPALIPDGGVNGIQVADVDGVKISGLLFDAGITNSAALLTVGTAGSHVSHAANPSSVQDVYFRIGGAVAGKATTSLIVNSDNAIVDHIWAWRADHGTQPTGWTVNTADTGLIVNGNNVLATGLFVEHYQKYEVLWNGQGGKTIFFQNEMPYDAPATGWTSGNGYGYAAYKVADSVTSHEAWGLGSYCFFNVNPSIVAARAFEVPSNANVKFHDLLTVSLGNTGTISHVINNTGPIAPQPGTNTAPSNVLNFP